MKKILSTAAVMLLTTGVVSASTIADDSAFLQDQQVISGQANTGDLDLGSTINRAELMKVLISASTVTEPSPEVYNNCFPDVTNQWFAPYICYAYAKGYVDGYDDGNFYPAREVNHAEAMKMVNEVLHMEAEELADIAGEEWYDLYYKNTLKHKLIDLDSGFEASDFAESATRGEVFSYVGRAKATQDTGAPVFSAELYEEVNNREKIREERALTAAEKTFLSLLRNQVAYGNQPMDSRGSLEIGFYGEEDGTSISMTIDIDQTMQRDGTEDELARRSDRYAMKNRIKANVDGEEVEFLLNVIMRFVVDEEQTFYALLEDFSVEDVDAPVVIRRAIFELVDAMTLYEGVWYSMSLEDLLDDVDSTEDLNQLIDAYEYFLKKSKEPFLQIAMSEDEDGIRFTLTPQLSGLIETLLAMSEELELEVNRYEIMEEIADVRRDLERLFAGTSMKILTTGDQFLVKAAELDILPFSFGEGGSSFTISLDVADQYTYPAEALEIEVPVDALPLEALIELLEGAAGMTEFTGVSVPVRAAMSFLGQVGIEGYTSHNTEGLDTSRQVATASPMDKILEALRWN